MIERARSPRYEVALARAKEIVAQKPPKHELSPPHSRGRRLAHNGHGGQLGNRTPK
ncbi:MAG: hypothetical protein WKF84_26475 [Pyrinomonadaceae bacterium]